MICRVVRVTSPGMQGIKVVYCGTIFVRSVADATRACGNGNEGMSTSYTYWSMDMSH